MSQAGRVATWALDERQQQIVEGLRECARLRGRLDARESELIDRGRSLGVPVTAMSEALGLARTTLGMRLKAAAGRSRAA
jgi:hypothetical protein